MQRCLTPGAGAIVLAPIDYDGATRGILGLRSRDPKAFDHASVETISLLAASAAVAMRNAEVVEGLARSERHYRELHAQSADATLVSDADGTLLDANAAAEALFWYSVDELRRLHVRDLFSAPGSGRRAVRDRRRCTAAASCAPIRSSAARTAPSSSSSTRRACSTTAACTRRSATSRSGGATKSGCARASSSCTRSSRRSRRSPPCSSTPTRSPRRSSSGHSGSPAPTAPSCSGSTGTSSSTAMPRASRRCTSGCGSALRRASRARPPRSARRCIAPTSSSTTAPTATAADVVGIRSLICAPLYRDGRVDGILAVMSGTPNAFDELSVETTRVMAQFVSTVFQNSHVLETRSVLAEELGAQAQVVEHMQTALWIWSATDDGDFVLQYANAASDAGDGTPERQADRQAVRGGAARHRRRDAGDAAARRRRGQADRPRRDRVRRRRGRAQDLLGQGVSAAGPPRRGHVRGRHRHRACTPGAAGERGALPRRVRLGVGRHVADEPRRAVRPGERATRGDPRLHRPGADGEDVPRHQPPRRRRARRGVRRRDARRHSAPSGRTSGATSARTGRSSGATRASRSSTSPAGRRTSSRSSRTSRSAARPSRSSARCSPSPSSRS